jgi:hypothetical protein
MFFGKSKSQQMVDETKRTIKTANQLSDEDRHTSAKFIIEKLIKLILQSEGLKITASFKKLTNNEYDASYKKMIEEHLTFATSMRQNSISEKQERDPKWIQACLLESYIIAKSDFIEDKEEQEISDLISFWIEENLTKEEWEKAMSDMEV